MDETLPSPKARSRSGTWARGYKRKAIHPYLMAHKTKRLNFCVCEYRRPNACPETELSDFVERLDDRLGGMMLDRESKAGNRRLQVPGLLVFQAGRKFAVCRLFAYLGCTAPWFPGYLMAQDTCFSLVSGDPRFLSCFLPHPPWWHERPGAVRLGGYADGLRISKVLAWLMQFWLTQFQFKLIYKLKSDENCPSGERGSSNWNCGFGPLLWVWAVLR